MVPVSFFSCCIVRAVQKQRLKKKTNPQIVRSGLGLENLGPRARRQGTILAPPPWRINVRGAVPPRSHR